MGQEHPLVCTICGKDAYGTYEDLVSHLSERHPKVLAEFVSASYSEHNAARILGMNAVTQFFRPRPVLEEFIPV